MQDQAIRVLHLSTFDRQGGAARAAFRLHGALTELGLHSHMKVQVKTSDDSSVSAAPSRVAQLKSQFIALLDRAPLALYQARTRTPFDVQWAGSCSPAAVASMCPDIIHLHWVTGGFLRVETLSKLARPIVWTLCDMWPFTGGCHVSGDCDRYRDQCGSCWQLGSTSRRDLSYLGWWRKRRAWRQVDLNLVAPSTWMAQCARSSSLFRDRPVRVIGNGLDTSVFRPLDKQSARECFGIDRNQVVILFGAVDPVNDRNKGFDMLSPAINVIQKSFKNTKIDLVVFGCSGWSCASPADFDIRFVGYLNDEISMALLYNAADVMVVPSRQESFCQTASEALACGTPVVAFNSTGLRDVVDHKVNGYLACPYEVQDLANGMRWVLEADRQGDVARRARQKAVENFALPAIARQYVELYSDVLKRYR